MRCLMSTPDFPLWSGAFAEHARRLHRCAQASLSQLQWLCRAWIPDARLVQEVDQDHSRTRHWPLQRTFWTFLWQVSQAGASCRDAVCAAIALGPPAGASTLPSEHTGPYCTARAKLPLERLDLIHREIVRDAQEQAPQRSLWQGRRVYAADGTCLDMPDTPANQKAYPQQNVQKPGCGFPILRLLAFFCLATGMMTHWACGTWYQHELSLLPGLLARLSAGDVLLGDRGFGNYPVLVQCVQRGIDAVVRANTARRRIDFRQGRRLGHHDRLVTWRKGPLRPGYLTKAEWAALPSELDLRVVKVALTIPGLRTRSVILVTTLLDPEAYPPHALAKLYLRRWLMELSFRHLKTTLQMDHLSCLSPETVERELRMHLLVHNLARRLALEAVNRHGGDLERISFAGTLALMHGYGDAMSGARSQSKRQELLDDFYRRLAGQQVPLRPGRREPRAVKRRPKPYPLLTCHRHSYREIPHRNRYRAKTSPRKNKGLK
jgi:hypothetical protein